MFQRDSYRSIMRAVDEAIAYRKNGMIYIFMIGELPTPCDEVKVVGKYPGTIFHVDEPGTAELFIEIGRKPGLEDSYCIQVLVPFFIGEEIQDSDLYDEVTIYVNGNINKRIKIEDKMIYCPHSTYHDNTDRNYCFSSMRVDDPVFKHFIPKSVPLIPPEKHIIPKPVPLIPKPIISMTIIPKVIFSDEIATLSWKIVNAISASMSEGLEQNILVYDTGISGTKFDSGSFGAGGIPEGGVPIVGSNIIKGHLFGQGNLIYTISARNNFKSSKMVQWIDILTVPKFQGNCTALRISNIKNAIKIIDAKLRNGCIIRDFSLDTTVNVFKNKHIDKMQLWERILAELQNMQLITFNCLDTNSQAGGRWNEYSNEIQLFWKPGYEPNYEYVILHELIHKSGLNSQLLGKGYNHDQIEDQTYQITNSCFL